jgi:hypothetical protein
MDMSIVYGLVGGLLPDVIRMINNRYNPALPDYLKSPNFYIGLVFLVLLGGGAAFLLHPVGIVETLAVGYSAPQLVSSLLSQKAPIIPGDKEDPSSRGLFDDQPKKPMNSMQFWGM